VTCAPWINLTRVSEPTTRTTDRPVLPLPDDASRTAARARLTTLDVPGAGLGTLEAAVTWAAGVQGRVPARPFSSVRVILVGGDHAGGASAGAPDWPRLIQRELTGGGPLTLLTAASGASLQVVDAALTGPELSEHRIRSGSAPFHLEDAITPEQMTEGLTLGERLVDEAVDSGADLIVPASFGAGADTIAATVVSVLTGTELPALLARVVTSAGRVDDEAWMDRCAAARDAIRRIHGRRRDMRTLLTALAGVDFAVLAGILLQAARRRTPVLIDDPGAAAALLLARAEARQVPQWCLIAGTGGHPTTGKVADVTGLTPLLDFTLDIGAGALALTALPLLNSAIALAAGFTTDPEPPQPAADSEDEAESDSEDSASESGSDSQPAPAESEAGTALEPESASDPVPDGESDRTAEPAAASEPDVKDGDPTPQ